MFYLNLKLCEIWAKDNLWEQIKLSSEKLQNIN